MPGLTYFTPSRSSPIIRLAQMENVTLTAHAAFRTLEASQTLLRRAIDMVRGIVDRQGCLTRRSCDAMKS